MSHASLFMLLLAAGCVVLRGLEAVRRFCAEFLC